MTLIATNQNGRIPPIPFADLFRNALLSECRLTMERVCNEVMSALGAEFHPASEADEVSVPGTISTPDEEADDYAAERKRCLRLGTETQVRNSKKNVIPRMMMLDMDFGGNLKADSVCARFHFNRDIYHEYKKTALAIYRCYKGFGGTLDITRTCQAAKICYQTFKSYVTIMKEGFHA